MSTQPEQATRDRVLSLLERELEGTLDNDSRGWLAAHRGAFPDLDEALRAVEGDGPLWEALGMPSDPMPPEELGIRDAITAHLDGQPVEALPLETSRRWGLWGLCAAVVVLALLGLGLRKDFAEQPSYLVTLPAGLLFAGFALALVSFDQLRQRLQRAAATAVLLAAPALFVGVAFAIEPTTHSHVAHSFAGPAVGCGVVGLVVALAVLAPTVVLARRGMAGPSELGALLLGVTTAAIGAAVLHLRCSIVDVPHVLVGHALLFALLPIAALALRRMRRLA